MAPPSVGMDPVVLEGADRLLEKGRREAAFCRALGDDREACEEGFGIPRAVVSGLGQVKRADPAVIDASR
jgi:hypothetical protein